MTSTPELLAECAKELRFAAEYAKDHGGYLSGAMAMARRIDEFLASYLLSETKTNSSPNDAIWPPEMELQSMAGGGFQRVKYIRADLVQSETLPIEATRLTIQKAVSDYTRRTPPHLRDCDVLTGHIIRALENAAQAPAVTGSLDATSEDAPAAAPAHIHRCMSCGERWYCPHPPADCKAGENALPSLTLRGPNGPTVFHHACPGKK